MNRSTLNFIALLLIILMSGPVFISAQNTPADYERAFGLQEKYTSQAINMPDRYGWIEKTNRFWYRKTIPGGNKYTVVDAAALSKRPAFDHEKLAAALSKALERDIDPKKLPFRTISFVDDEKVLELTIGDWIWECDLATYTCTKLRERRRWLRIACVPDITVTSNISNPHLMTSSNRNIPPLNTPNREMLLILNSRCSFRLMKKTD